MRRSISSLLRLTAGLAAAATLATAASVSGPSSLSSSALAAFPTSAPSSPAAPPLPGTPSAPGTYNPSNTLHGSTNNPPPTVGPNRLPAAQAAVDRTSTNLVNEATPADAKIAMAVQNAADNLQAEIGRQPLRQDLTVADLLVKTGAAGDLRAVLAKAEPVGGVRWIDTNLCQVRLRIAGKVVQDVILRASLNQGSQSPITPAAVRTAMSGWERRSFSALGTNAARVEAGNDPATQSTAVALPPVPPTWARQAIQASGHGAPAPTKLKAARSAQQAALDELGKSVADLKLTDKQTVADLRTDPVYASVIDQTLLRAKATDIMYHADGSADVRMSLDLSILWFQLQSTANEQQPGR